ncbi:MAG: sulfotransferase family protein [Rhodanobacter sp.]|nr:MAG: sulfotransferase family protein [Rhodanobacter sp.]
MTASTASSEHAHASDTTRLAEVQALLEARLDQTPDDVASLIELSQTRFRRGHFRAASPPLLHAAGHLPHDATQIVALVQRLIAQGEIVVARRCLQLLAQAPQPPAELLATQAHLQFMLGDHDWALRTMTAAISAGVDSPGELHMYAMLLQFSGQADAAQAVLERCLARWPSFGDALSVLVNLRRQRPENQRLGWITDRLRELPQDSAPEHCFVRAEFEYACFKTMDDLDQRDEAWAALDRCNALMRKLNPYDAAAEERVTAALAGMAKPPEPRHACSPGPLPIFIVGMPRSGTTLLDRILSSHSQVASAGEIIDFWRQLHWVADVPPARTAGLLEIVRRSARIDYRELGERYLAQTRWRAQGKAWYVDKLPANIQLVGFIRRALPQAPILHLVRDPMDVCFSNYKALFGNISAYSYGLDSVAHYHGQYARLTRHWRTALPGTMLDVPYADLVQRTEDTVRKVLQHCGLTLENACLHPEHNAAPVATPSSAQVREAIHRRGLGQWQRYARELEPLRRVLAEQGNGAD